MFNQTLISCDENVCKAPKTLNKIVLFYILKALI